jgi:hypothetical protein
MLEAEDVMFPVLQSRPHQEGVVIVRDEDPFQDDIWQEELKSYGSTQAAAQEGVLGAVAGGDAFPLCGAMTAALVSALREGGLDTWLHGLSTSSGYPRVLWQRQKKWWNSSSLAQARTS